MLPLIPMLSLVTIFDRYFMMKRILTKVAGGVVLLGTLIISSCSHTTGPESTSPVNYESQEIRPIVLQISPVTLWNGGGTQSRTLDGAYDELYQIVVGGAGFPVKAKLVDIDQSGVGTKLRFQVNAQAVKFDWGTDMMGAMTSNFYVTPSQNTFEIHCAQKTVIPWGIGETIQQVSFDSGGRVVNIQESVYSLSLIHI